MKYNAISKETHEFAIFVESLSSLVQQKKIGDSIIFSDEKLIHRMVNVLRLKIRDRCILFDQYIKVLVVIDALSKKQISILMQSVEKSEILKPTIIFLLPLLKRDDYESALYNLTEVGVNVIQLLFTEKTAHQWDNRDNDRAQRILIAAAEQSKNFAYPELRQPISLVQALQKYQEIDLKLFFDQKGKPLFDVIPTLHASKSKNILLFVGPEGDLTIEEKKMVQFNDFIFCALTPTTLRAVQAVALGAGFVRSLLISTPK